MPENIQAISRRIASVSSTQQITKAMKMVAAAKLRKAEERATNSKLYAEKIEKVLKNLLASARDFSNPLFEVRDVKKIRILLVSADKGLCGGFNHNIIKYAHAFAEEKISEGFEVELQLVGKKAIDFFKYRNIDIFSSHTDIYGEKITPFSKELAKSSVMEFIDQSFDELYVFYNSFVSVVKNEPVNVRILPISNIDGNKEEEDGSAVEHLYEPSREEVLEVLIPKYFFTSIQEALMDSEASEHSSRMRAMDTATNNARDLIELLTLTRNRIRQASITNDLIEIVSAAEALNG